MRALAVFALIALSVHLPAHAGESVLTIADALGKSQNQELLDHKLAMFWGDQVPPTGLVEPSRPEIFSGIEANAIPFTGGVRHCQAAFRKAQNNLVEDAHKMGYDVAYGIRSVVQGVPGSDAQRAVCSHIVHITSMKLQAVLARTPAMAARVAEAEAQAIFGTSMTWHVGSTSAPAYALQLGPMESEGEASVKKLGEPGACKNAVFDALSSLVKDLCRNRRVKVGSGNRP